MINIDVTGDADDLQRARKGLADLTPLHARIADATLNLTREYVAGLDEHRTAIRLGARPTGHLAKAARTIESTSDADKATLRIPRASRLRAAFGEFTIRPGPGKKYLTIPDHVKTYGKRVGEIQEPLHFQIVGGRHKALCFADGSVAFWLRTEVTIKEDTGLLPFAAINKLSARVASDFVDELMTGGVA